MEVKEIIGKFYYCKARLLENDEIFYWSMADDLMFDAGAVWIDNELYIEDTPTGLFSEDVESVRYYFERESIGNGYIALKFKSAGIEVLRFLTLNELEGVTRDGFTTDGGLAYKFFSSKSDFLEIVKRNRKAIEESE